MQYVYNVCPANAPDVVRAVLDHPLNHKYTPMSDNGRLYFPSVGRRSMGLHQCLETVYLSSYGTARDPLQPQTACRPHKSQYYGCELGILVDEELLAYVNRKYVYAIDKAPGSHPCLAPGRAIRVREWGFRGLDESAVRDCELFYGRSVPFRAFRDRSAAAVAHALASADGCATLTPYTDHILHCLLRDTGYQICAAQVPVVDPELGVATFLDLLCVAPEAPRTLHVVEVKTGYESVYNEATHARLRELAAAECVYVPDVAHPLDLSMPSGLERAGYHTPKGVTHFPPPLDKIPNTRLNQHFLQLALQRSILRQAYGAGPVHCTLVIANRFGCMLYTAPRWVYSAEAALRAGIVKALGRPVDGPGAGASSSASITIRENR
jgi:hypothetical protein